MQGCEDSDAKIQGHHDAQTARHFILHFLSLYHDFRKLRGHLVRNGLWKLGYVFGYLLSSDNNIS